MELAQARRSGDAQRIREEYGDCLHALVGLGRHLGVGAEDALRETNARFEGRFREVERRVVSRGQQLGEVPHEQLELLWTQVKADAASDGA